MYLVTMLLTKRHAMFLAVNALLIFVNFQLWVYDPESESQRTLTRPDVSEQSHEYVDASHEYAADTSIDNHLGKMAPKRMKTTPQVHSPGKSMKNVTLSNRDIVKLWRSKHLTYNNATKPETDMYVTPINIKQFQQLTVDAKLRQNYRVPNITTTNLVNCVKILSNDKEELEKAQKLMLTRPKVPIYEETYLEWFRDCAQFRRTRGYVEIPLTAAEEETPLAFSVAMYTDIESTERLLRAIYRPNNLYCIHIDTKSSLLTHRTVRALASCFDNVWIASHLDKVKWGDISVILPEIDCMSDLMKYYKNKKWKYFINLTGQEFPLRTNYELARISQIFNGSNDIGGSIARMDVERVKYHWTHRWSKTYQQTIFYNTFMPKEPPPYNLTFFKGELHGLFSHGMVEYLVQDPRAKKYLEWCWDTGHPSEHYWNTLNYNRHVSAPGGYEGPVNIADNYSEHQISRVKNWLGLYNNRTCKGKLVRGICVYGVEDAPWLATRHELFANKFHLTYQYLGYDCLEELHRNRTKLKDKVPFSETFYKNLPTVKYSRKDGLRNR